MSELGVLIRVLVRGHTTLSGDRISLGVHVRSPGCGVPSLPCGAGLAPEIPLTVVYASEYSLLKYAQTLADMDDPPLVNSVSYG